MSTDSSCLTGLLGLVIAVFGFVLFRFKFASLFIMKSPLFQQRFYLFYHQHAKYQILMLFLLQD